MKVMKDAWVDACRLVVTGGSAGGTSTFLHTDTIGTVVEARHTVGMPDAGAFRVVPDGCCDWVSEPPNNCH